MSEGISEESCRSTAPWTQSTGFFRWKKIQKLDKSHESYIEPAELVEYFATVPDHL
jgi:hypothetical protein